MTKSKQPHSEARQRLDKWLFFIRFAKSRTLAQGFIQSGHVRVNGLPIKQSGYLVKCGDKVDIRSSQIELNLIILSCGERRWPYEEAKLLYEDVTPAREASGKLNTFEQAIRDPGTGRPTKKDRRAIDQFIADSQEWPD